MKNNFSVYLTFLCFILWATFGCTHKEALQILPGTKLHPMGVSQSVCQHYILGFPTNADLNTIHGAIKELKVNENEIYSIEKSSWPYFWFLVYPTCIELYMNDKYVVVSGLKESTTQMGGIKIQDEQETKKFSAPEKFLKPGELTGNAQEDLERCGELFGVEKRQCLKKISDYYDGEKK